MILFVPILSMILLFCYFKFWERKTKGALFYLAFCAIVFFSSLLGPFSKTKADDFQERTMNEFKIEISLPQWKRDLYFQACQQFTMEGYEYLRKAEEISLLIPNYTWREWAHTIIESTMSTVMVQDPKAKIVTAAIVTLSQYIKGVYDNWEDIDYYMKEAEHRFQIVDVYQDKLFRDAD